VEAVIVRMITEIYDNTRMQTSIKSKTSNYSGKKVFALKKNHAMKLLNNKLFAKIEKRNRKCLLQIRKKWVQNLTNKQTPEGRSKTAKVLNSKRNRFSEGKRTLQN
jgi:hypothetical protein